MAMRRQFLLGLSVMMLFGCAHQFVLTTGGMKVQVTDRGQLPDGCRVIADVSIGQPPDAAVAVTEAELTTLIRNKAADLGADHVVMERTERRPGADGIDHFVGSASAYACSAVPVAEEGGSETTGGGEEL